ncbi:hypothetical protein JXD38_06095 [candidate division WOR-3 bacterium]|nr:hypothetical protein [candidate division WOR-3 bacterium]
MSKFDQIRQAYVDARKSFFAQRNASAAFAVSLVKGMEQYLESPPYQIRFLSNTRQTSAATSHDASDSVTYGSDGIWHFRLGMELVDDQGGVGKAAPRQNLTFELLAKPDGAAYSVGMKGWDDRFTVAAAGDSPERTRFYDFWFKLIIDSYLQPGHRFFENMADSDRTVQG